MKDTNTNGFKSSSSSSNSSSPNGGHESNTYHLRAPHMRNLASQNITQMYQPTSCSRAVQLQRLSNILQDVLDMIDEDDDFAF